MPNRKKKNMIINKIVNYWKENFGKEDLKFPLLINQVQIAKHLKIL